MNRWMYRAACLGVAGTMLSGCTTMQRSWPGVGFAPFSRNQSVEGPQALIDQQFEEIDLALLLEAGGTASSFCPNPTPNPTVTYPQRLQQAFCNFYQASTDKVQARNAIQDRIVASSNQRCAEYKQFLKRYDTDTNNFLGIAAVATGGAGAIVRATDAARALAGITGILSGMRAEINTNTFQQRTVQVLTAGFEEKRKTFQAEMLQHRTDSLTLYTVERAIGDAIRYHDHCSLIAGLEYAAYAIARVDDPGLNALRGTFTQMRDLYGLLAVGTGQILLPRNAYNEAEKARQDLELKQKELENCATSLQADPGDPANRKTEKDNLRPVCTDLKKRISLLLGDAKKQLDQSKAEAEALQQRLPSRQEAVYKAAANNADRAGAEASLSTDQTNAHRLIGEFNSLKESLWKLTAEATSLLERINAVGRIN